MTCGTIIEALALPPDTLVDQRVPKTLLIANGAPTTADKRQIQNGIEEVVWLASLKATNIGVPAFRDATREYLEIAVLTVSLRAEAKASRITELIHRAIPYPVVLVTAQGNGLAVSLAHKRWSQGEADEVVLEDAVATAVVSAGTPAEQDFLATLPLAAQPRQDLFALYQGWLDRIAALAAARLTGAFVMKETPEAATARRTALDDHAQLQRELASLRAQAERETQINRRVELNLDLKRLEARLGELAGLL